MDVYAWLRRSISRPKDHNTSSSSANGESKKKVSVEEDVEFYGITEKLIEFINTFTLDTFRSFPLLEEDEANSGEESKEVGGNVRKDLSEWQEWHATIVLSEVKVLSQLRFRLCPGHLKERQFWRIYFALVKPYVSEYQLRAIQLARLRQMKIENDAVASNSACEVEMSETKQAHSFDNEEG